MIWRLVKMGTLPLMIHVDVDSPNQLLRFWGSERTVDLSSFYTRAMGRLFEILEDYDVSATIFCVAGELEKCDAAADAVRAAAEAGHEIASHSLSHPIGLTRLDDDAIDREIVGSADIIEATVGSRPRGFRAPSYDVDNRVLECLERAGYVYDSSAFWSILQPLMRWYHAFRSGDRSGASFGTGSRWIPREPYHPSRSDWARRGESGNAMQLLELPLPRTRVLNLPFYNNFHLASGNAFRYVSHRLIRQSQIVYLLHLIEFTDPEDDLPEEISAHPNLGLSWKSKRASLGNTLRWLSRRYSFVRTDRFVADLGCTETAEFNA